MADRRAGVFLENYRARGQSFDSFAGEPGTFDFSRNIDIFAKLKGICLATKEEVNEDADYEAVDCYCLYGEDSLYKIVNDGDDIHLYVSDGSDFDTFGTLEHTIDQSTLGILTADRAVAYNAVVFDNKIYVLGDKQVFEYDPATTSSSKVTPASWYDEDCTIIPSFNYHETLLVLAKNDKVWTYDPLLGVSLGRSTVRDFSQGKIVGLLQYEELIGVCVNHNGIDSRIYVLGGNFDVDDIGVLDTIPLEGISMVNVAQMGNRIFFASQDHGDSGRGVWYELRGKTPVPLKESRNDVNVHSESTPSGVADGDFDFIVKKTNSLSTGLLVQPYPTKGNMIYIPTVDGIWIYGSPNIKVPEAMFYFHDYINVANAPNCSIIFKDYLYVHGSGGEMRFYIGKDTSVKKYESSGYLKGRTYPGDFMVMEKEVLNLAIAYSLPHADCSIKVRMKRNGDSWQVVHTITDTTKNFIVVDPTNVNGVSEILGDRNYIDYALELVTTNESYTPIVYEHAIFYDYVRTVL